MSDRYTAFQGAELRLSGPLPEIAAAAWEQAQRPDARPLLILDDQSGRPVDLDLRGTREQAIARAQEEDAATARSGPGRPKLGVRSREVSLLPRHWDWLGAQPRSSSATLRRLVDGEMKRRSSSDRLREARDALYRAMSALAGDLPGFEEASRALFSGDREGLRARIAAWPEGLRGYLDARAEALPDAPAEGGPARHLRPSQAAGRAFVARRLQGPVVMLNLLRFRERADYSAAPALAPAAPISGEAAYRRYMAEVEPLLGAKGGRLRFLGQGGGAWLIGPEDERWDLTLLVEHRSAADFLAFASDPAYQEIAGHRTAALEDSRLLPLQTP